MKKTYKIMLWILAIIAITGCSKENLPDNGSENVISFTKGDFGITVNDLYKELKDRYATNYLINEIDKKILNDKYETDEKATSYVENQMKIYRMAYNNDESQLLSAIQSAGYRSISEFEETLLTSYKRGLAKDDYLRKSITDSEINTYYEENVYGDITISHILIKLDVNDGMTDEEKEEAEKKVQDKIDEIYEKLNDVESVFADIAKEYSEDAATASDGGRLGTFNKEDMTKKYNREFEDAVIALEVGKFTSKVVKSSYGYHIIYKDEQKEKPALETVKQTIIDALIDDKEDEDTKAEYKALIALREEYGLKINDDEIQSQYDTAVNNWLYGDSN